LNIGKLNLEINLEDLKKEIARNNFEILPLDFEHINGLSKLELIHRDPFDRIIISQAISEDYTIISKDSNFQLYNDLKLLW
jgi:PIN domain nuclease of toxin-antitoxin system